LRWAVPEDMLRRAARPSALAIGA